MSDIVIKNLKVDFITDAGPVQVLRGIDFTVKEKEVTAIIGESGSGKSVMANAILDMLPPYASISGQIIYQGQDILQERMEHFYGGEFGLIPQYPGESLNPSKTILQQFMLTRPSRIKRGAHKKQAHDLLSYMGFDQPDKILAMYPHELSGGMSQRVICALSLIQHPQWIIADEPTKGLDEDVKWQVVDNLNKVRQLSQSSMLIITHDLEVAEALSDRLAIMYGGRIVETGKDILQAPNHPYTQAFIQALPENGFVPMGDIKPGAMEGVGKAAREKDVTG